jgi:hypothetical protein
LLQSQQCTKLQRKPRIVKSNFAFGIGKKIVVIFDDFGGWLAV